MTNAADTTAPRLLDGYITEAEFCAQIGVIDRTARKWRQSGEGPPFVKLGHGVFYPLEGFRKWLAKRVQGSGR
jgi:hypothetical protein